MIRALRLHWMGRILLLLFILPVAVTTFCARFTKKRGFVRDDGLFLHKHQQEEEQEGPSGLGLYVHIPYCRRRCNYCDFAIVPIGPRDHGDRARAGFEIMDADYKHALLNEIDALGRSSPDKIRLRSMYFGGGTPSLAPLSTLRDVMHALLHSENAPFCLDDEDAETTIEMDPGTFDLSYLAAVKEMGFNRISLGVQSFDDELLETMGRVHRAADVHRSVDMIGEVFGEDDANYSIDLISGVPGLTLAKWTETLAEAVRLRPRPTHMSLYDLQVERGTAFGKWYGDAEDDVIPDAPRHGNSASSRPALPSAEDCAFMYSYASGYLLSRNYEHYEISSYALRNDGDGGSSRRSAHNQIYWEYGGQWHAVGLGATSNIDGARFARPRALSDYIAWTEGLARNSTGSSPGRGAGDAREPTWPWKEPSADGDLAGESDALLDTVMTRLRTMEGLDLDWVVRRDKHGEASVEAILRGFELALELRLGVREVRPRGRHGCIRLKDPRGFLFSNNIISSIFAELSDVDR